MKHTEVEQKFRLKNHAELRAQLKELDAKRLRTEHQIDTYYNAPHRDFLAKPIVNEWLRLREEDGQAYITYKCWLPLEAKVKTHCDEFESELGDAEAARKLLEALNFTELIVVDKQREEWRFDDLIVALDTVKGMGDFVEFEYNGNADSVVEAQKCIEQGITALGVELGERSFVGYPKMMLEIRAKSTGETK